ncbi:MAG: ribonuclease HI family protein [Promethearchaeota archaeon]
MNRKLESLKVYTDGAARGNPGPAACAFLYVHNNEIIYSEVSYIGNATNNQAEYQAIINAMKKVGSFHAKHIKIFSDSKLVIQQLNRKWKINVPHLSKLSSQVFQMIDKFEKVDFFHVRRNNSFIQKCDLLCNERLDNEGIKGKS